jgi:hypothetical protein
MKAICPSETLIITCSLRFTIFFPVLPERCGDYLKVSHDLFIPYPLQFIALSLGVKRLGRETNHSPPPSAEVKNVWSYTTTLQYAF